MPYYKQSIGNYPAIFMNFSCNHLGSDKLNNVELDKNFRIQFITTTWRYIFKRLLYNIWHGKKKLVLQELQRLLN